MKAFTTPRLIWKKILGNETTFKNAQELTGTDNYGAPVVTKGGLVLIAATKDGKFRAFHKRTGALLWEDSLPAPVPHRYTRLMEDNILLLRVVVAR